jgi:hypothetical protein
MAPHTLTDEDIVVTRLAGAGYETYAADTDGTDADGTDGTDADGTDGSGDTDTTDSKGDQK